MIIKSQGSCVVDGNLGVLMKYFCLENEDFKPKNGGLVQMMF